MGNREKRQLKKQQKQEQMKTEDPLGFFAYKGGKKLSSYIQKVDQFGQPITLSFQGNAHYTTCPSGFMTLFIIIASFFFMIGQFEKLIKTESVALGYFEQLANTGEAGLNYTLSDAENMTMSFEFEPKGSWVNKDQVNNETIKERVHEIAKMMDVTAQVYMKNTSRGTSQKAVGWPILQENFTQVLSINSHENWEFKIDLQDMIMSGSRDFNNQLDQYYTQYDVQINKHKMYREAYFRCLSTRACNTHLPDDGQMINAQFDHIKSNPYLSAEIKQLLGDMVQRVVDSDPRVPQYYQYIHDYASLTKTVVNTPTSSDVLYVTVSGTQYKVNAGNSGYATIPGFSATKQIPKYATTELFTQYAEIWSELEKEINEIGKNFSLNVVLYDETEDYYDTELKYPYLKRRTELGTSFSIDLADPTYETLTTYFKKSEVCEDKPNYSFIKDASQSKEQPGYVSPKVCLYQKMKQSHVVATKSKSQSGTDQTKKICEMSFKLDPMISTLVVRRNESETVFIDVLVELGGFISLLWFILMPIGKYISRVLYDADLITSLYLRKDVSVSSIELTREQLKEIDQQEQQEFQIHDPNIQPQNKFQNLEQEEHNSVEMDGGSALMTPHGEKDLIESALVQQLKPQQTPQTMQMMLDQMQKSFSKIKMTTSQVIFDPFMQVCRWRKKGREAHQRQQLLNAGQEKKDKQLDLVNVIHKINFSYDILRNFVSKDQKKLLNFNKSKVIDLFDEEENGSSSDPEYDGKFNIKRKVKASKLLNGSEGFSKKVNSSVITGLSLHKGARIDLTNMIQQSNKVQQVLPQDQIQDTERAENIHSMVSVPDITKENDSNSIEQQKFDPPRQVQAMDLVESTRKNSVPLKVQLKPIDSKKNKQLASIQTTIPQLEQPKQSPKVLEPEEQFEEPEGPYFEPPNYVSTKEEQQDLKKLFSQSKNAKDLPKKDNSETALLQQNESLDQNDVVIDAIKSATPDDTQNRKRE